MSKKHTIALGATTAALLFTVSAGALAAGGTTVTVRIEGKSKTLLAAHSVTTHSGSITKGGAPAGKCPATSGQGALDVATHHSWSGKFDASLGSYFIKTILGETDSGPKIYWGIWVNNVPASTGACGVKLHPGDTLLFAASKYPSYPLAIIVPGSARVGQPFDAKVVWFNAKGKSKPLAGATVSVTGHTGKTNSHGIVPLTPSHTGAFSIAATDKGYVRSAVTVNVTG